MVCFSIVVPCFNEEEGVELTVRDIFSNVKGCFEVLVVDDGSTDNTFKVVESLVSEFKGLRVLRHERNLGKRHALDTGSKAAKFDVVVHIDGDFSYPAKYVNKVVSVLVSNGLDMVYGSRFLGERVVMSFSHKLGNRFFSLLFSLLLFRRVTDVTSGLRALYKDKYFGLGLESPNFGVEAELMVKAVKRGWSFCEVPIGLRKRVGVEKLRTFRDGFVILLTLLKYRFFK